MYSTNQVAEIFHLIYTYSYFILFPLMVVEGPIVTIIAGFLTSTGFLDPFPTYLTVVAGDLAGDILYYSAGRWWFTKSIKNVLSFFKVKEEKLIKIEKSLLKNKGKVLFLGKLSQAIGGFVLFVSGYIKMPFKIFLWFNFLGTILKSFILLLVGYYFGSAISNYNKYLNFTVLGLFLITLLLVAVYYVVSKVASKVLNSLK